MEEQSPEKGWVKVPIEDIRARLVGSNPAEGREFDRGERDRLGRPSPELPGIWRISGPRYPRSSRRVLP
jgi:hypothetical protein